MESVLTTATILPRGHERPADRPSAWRPPSAKGIGFRGGVAARPAWPDTFSRQKPMPRRAWTTIADIAIICRANMPRRLRRMGTAPRVVLVWDIPIRVFHWLIVALVAAAYATWRLNWMVWHGWVGDAVLALLLFRLSWGFFGGETARFSHFLTSPANGRSASEIRVSARARPPGRAQPGWRLDGAAPARAASR